MSTDSTAVAPTPKQRQGEQRAPTPWAPFRHRHYLVLWLAQFTSNIGTWMQTVGAQWLMVSLAAGPLMVALVQTAMSLPVVALALVSGAVGDIADRRRLLLASQSFMLVSAAVLAALTLAGITTPWMLLGLTFAIGLGQAMTGPSWQAIQPELVERDEISQAAALGSVNINVARAVGPAIGGAVVAGASAGAVFTANAASFLGVLGALRWWRREVPARALGAEHLRSAIRAGARYARHSRRLRAVLVRAALFVGFASALWALLPVVAHRELHLGSGGYGLLLADFGVGALLGAVALTRLRRRWSLDFLVAAATALFAAACLMLAWSPGVIVDAFALIAAGMGWIAVLGSLNGNAQTVLPNWVRSRGMALYILVFHGGQAAGAFVWGLVADQAGTRVALIGVAAGLIIGLPGALRYRLLPHGDLDVSPHPSSELQLPIEPDPSAGPVLVTVDYRVPSVDHQEFLEIMQHVARSRRRTGAERWGLYRDAADPEVFVETFVVPTWEEHLRQRQERRTVSDHRFEQRARAYLVEGEQTRTRHLFWAYR
ncbi:MAG: MFS transporter [Solirubrobacteraceae bacterium]|nr:MAG: MFS transporter [Solirubrobacterales bacterium]